MTESMNPSNDVSKVDPSTIVTLDVGGKKFKTRVETLVRSRYFHNLFLSERWSPSPTREPFFIDRCPKKFAKVLQLLRDDRYPVPEGVRPELDYFGIEWESSLPEPCSPIDFQVPFEPDHEPFVMRVARDVVQLGVALFAKINLVAVSVVVRYRGMWTVSCEATVKNPVGECSPKDPWSYTQTREVWGKRVVDETISDYAGVNQKRQRMFDFLERVEEAMERCLPLCGDVVRKTTQDEQQGPPAVPFGFERRITFYFPARVSMFQLNSTGCLAFGSTKGALYDYVPDGDFFRDWFLQNGSVDA